MPAADSRTTAAVASAASAAAPDLLAAATWYASELDWPTFPVEPNGKKPLTAHGFKDASTDLDQIDTWWRQWPAANIGVPTGRVTGITGVDIDPRHGGDVEASIAKMPETVWAKTGGGGAHLLFKHPGFDTVKSIGKGYDIKSDGGYIVVPPSVHACGQRYEWELEPTVVQIANAPDSLLNKMRITKPATSECTEVKGGQPAALEVIARAAQYVGKVPGAIEGQNGDDLTYVVACKLMRDFGLSHTQAFPLFCEWNQKCEPRWSEDELKAKLDNAKKYGKHQIGTKVTPRAGAKTETRVDSTSPPKPIRERPKPVAYQAFPVDVLPEPLRSTVNVGASALGCDRAFIALPLLSALAAAIGNARWIELKKGWREPPALWTALVAESGDLKSPAFRFAVKPLRERQSRTLKRHVEEMAQYEVEELRYEKKLAAWKRDGNEDEPPPEKPERLEAERCIVSDITTEAIATILAANPRGVLLARDELAGWIGGFDRYAGGKGGGDAAHWLSMFNGESLVVDRKSGQKRTTFIPSALVTVTGTVQPAILHRVIGSEYRESGLLARILLAAPPRRVRRWTESEISSSSEATIALLFERLFDLEPEHDDQGEPRPRIMTLTPEGKRSWVTFYNEHANEHAELSGDLSAAWSKLEGCTARLALILHCVRCAAGDPALENQDQVDEVSITAGVTLSRWFANEVRRVYAVMGESEGDRERRQLIELIQRKGGEITVREIVRSSRMFSCSGDAEAALQGLADSGDGVWITSKSGPQGGPPSKRFRLVASTVDSVDVDITPAHDPKTGGCVNVNSVNAPADDDWGVV